MTVEILQPPPKPSTEYTNLSQERDRVRRAQAGDPEAWTSLFIDKYPIVYAYCLSRTNNHDYAQDLASEVFVRVVERIGEYEDRGLPFSSWLFKIARNCAVDKYRRDMKERNFNFYEKVYSDLIEPGPEENVVTKITLEEILRRIQELPKSQRDVVELRFVADLSVAETARVVGKTKNNVKVIQHKALRQLRQMIPDRPQPDKPTTLSLLQILMDSSRPLSTAELARRLAVASGSVSMTIGKLHLRYGISIRNEQGGGWYLESDEKEKVSEQFIFKPSGIRRIKVESPIRL